MVQAVASVDRGTGPWHAFRSNGGRIAASMLALGLAAFLAGSLVPAIHRVSIRLSGDPLLASRWSDAALHTAVGRVAAQDGHAPAGVLAAWNDLVERVMPSRPETRVERLPDGSLRISTEDRDAAAARRRADDLAALIAGASTPAQAGVEAPTQVPEGDPLAALKLSVGEAREALAAAEDRLARAKAEQPGSPDDAGRSSAADADRQAAAAAKQELGAVQRLRDALRNGVPAEAPTSIQGSEEWASWNDARTRRDQVAGQVADLSRTLLDGHPRMATVRLRLSDLDDQVDAARPRLDAFLDRRIATLRRTADRLDRQVADSLVAAGASDKSAAAVAKATSDVDAARGTLLALDDALRAAERSLADSQASANAAPAPVPTPLASIATDVVETEHRPNIWPIVAGAALFGLLGSSLFAFAGTARQRGERLSSGAARRVFTRRPPVVAPPQRETAGSSYGITAPDELIGGLLASDITRLVVVSLGADDRPAAVEIVRRLALRGRQGALLDLSEQQLAARAMGVPPDALGVSDMIAGGATFAEIARSDFATRAEAFGTGRATVGEAAFLAMERRNVLEFIERNYELLIVVCGDMDAETVQSLLTPDAALVLTVDGEDDARIASGVRRLRDAGLSDMILVDGRQFAA